MFALESLHIAGETYANSDNVKRACDFLIGKQKEDGGWGETYLVRISCSHHPFPASIDLSLINQSCVNLEYDQHPTSQVVMTSWAVLALIYGRYPDTEPIRRACQLIMSRQKPDGRWEQEDTEGIFNKNCAIDYPAFKFIFCIWALGKADRYMRGEEC